MIAKPQFSLRLLFVFVAAAAVIVGVVAAFPAWVALIVGVAVTSFLPPGLVAGIVYARGFTQAFCIGALAWLLAARWVANLSLGLPETLLGPGAHELLSEPADYEYMGVEYRVDYCVMWSLTSAGGLVAVVVRWLTLSKSPSG